MADSQSSVEETDLFTYTLDVPLTKSGSIGGDARFSCCHATATSGHASTCDPGQREATIRAALQRAGFDVQTPGTLTPTGDDDQREEDREWLAEFLNHAPNIDPHDDESGIVDLIAPYARLLRICLDARDRRASMDKQPGDPETTEARLPVEALLASNAAMRAFLRPVAGIAVTDTMLQAMRELLDAAPKVSPGDPDHDHLGGIGRGELNVLTSGTQTGRIRAAERNENNAPKTIGVIARDVRVEGYEDVGGRVHHPKHYNEHPAGIECVDVNEWMTANIAAAIKYVWRAGLKPDSKHDRDLASAVWYIERERKRVQMVPRHTDAYGGGAR